MRRVPAELLIEGMKCDPPLHLGLFRRALELSGVDWRRGPGACGGGRRPGCRGGALRRRGGARLRWTRMPGRHASSGRATVIVDRRLSRGGQSPHRTAAESWLSSAPSPTASVAAIAALCCVSSSDEVHARGTAAAASPRATDARTQPALRPTRRELLPRDQHRAARGKAEHVPLRLVRSHYVPLDHPRRGGRRNEQQDAHNVPRPAESRSKGTNARLRSEHPPSPAAVRRLPPQTRHRAIRRLRPARTSPHPRSEAMAAASSATSTGSPSHSTATSSTSPCLRPRHSPASGRPRARRPAAPRTGRASSSARRPARATRGRAAAT